MFLLVVPLWVADRLIRSFRFRQCKLHFIRKEQFSEFTLSSRHLLDSLRVFIWPGRGGENPSSSYVKTNDIINNNTFIVNCLIVHLVNMSNNTPECSKSSRLIITELWDSLMVPLLCPLSSRRVAVLTVSRAVTWWLLIDLSHVSLSVCSCIAYADGS